MDLDDEIGTLVSRELENLGLELVKLERFPRGRRWILRIFVDRPESSVTVDDCVRVSRALGITLEGGDMISGPYNLEVSSPGIDRPLTKWEHYHRFRGKGARVEHMDENGSKTVTIGEIVNADAETVTLAVDGVEKKIPVNAIRKGNLHGEKWEIPKKKKKKGRNKP